MSSSFKLLEDLKRRRELSQEDRQRLKKRLKETESLEEKRARRIHKKESKERRRKEKLGWAEDHLSYTDHDNPFGDSQLLSEFVWKKKFEQEGLDSLSKQELEQRKRIKLEENRRELEKVKARRLQREQERKRRDEEMSFIQRCKEGAQLEELTRQDDRFYLENARLRSQIRIKEGRAKPIDLLAQYIRYFHEPDVNESVALNEPCFYVDNLQLDDLEDLEVDIPVYIKLENGQNSDFWNNLIVLVQHRINELKKYQGRGSLVQRSGIAEETRKNIEQLLNDKSTEELLTSQKQIQQKIDSKSEGLDINYWNYVLASITVYLARSRLKDKHKEFLKKQSTILKQYPNIQLDKNPKTEKSIEITKNDENITSRMNNLPNMCKRDYQNGNYSPVLLKIQDLDVTVPILLHKSYVEEIENERNSVLSRNCTSKSRSVDDKLVKIEASKGMQEDESEFSVEEQLDNQVYLWTDKYRPRKPRYFNRVHTGFEWNKYNQTHYDIDNPPPKVVQGYKFNIFYPDVIDKSTTPEYSLTSCADNKDFAILRFTIGPPYEDIAFKIVNREWEFSYKRGFRCQFHNNVFQLWFHFKRYRYRR